jgi:hypothetical protein
VPERGVSISPPASSTRSRCTWSVAGSSPISSRNAIIDRFATERDSAVRFTTYLHNQAELDAYMARLEAQGLKEYEAWARSPSPAIERLRALRAERDLARAS